MNDTREASYAQRLEQFDKGWRRLLDVQRPYRWNIRRLNLGFVLDVGCGVGRNLKHLGANAGVGVDHSAASVALARSRGLVAFTPDEFLASEYARPGRFDSLLLAHVVEHMPFDQAVALVGDHLRFVRPGGKLALIVPQQAGYKTDPTHVEYFDGAKLERLCDAHQLRVLRSFSFPFPALAGHLFPYNESVAIAELPARPA